MAIPKMIKIKQLIVNTYMILKGSQIRLFLQELN